MRLHFVKFETKYIGTCVDFIQENILKDGGGFGKVLKTTGNATVVNTSSKPLDGHPAIMLVHFEG